MILAILLAVQPAAAAAAADWRDFGHARGMTLAWDAARIERGETNFVRVRTTPPTPGNIYYAYAITRIEMRCAPAEARAVETVNYRADGTPGRSDTTPQSFVPIQPGSLFDPLHSALCPAPPAAPQ